MPLVCRPSQRYEDPMPTVARRLSMGAELASGGVHFRIFAPERKRVEVVIDGRGQGARSTGFVKTRRSR